jgi:hypothetical protein
MATKVNATDKGGNKMTPADIKKYQKMLADIGSGKEKGFIIIQQINVDEKKGTMRATGTAYTETTRGHATLCLAKILKLIDISPTSLMIAGMADMSS